MIIRYNYPVMVLILTMMVVITPACSKNPAPMSPLSTDAVVLSFGDSLTFGTGAKTQQSYPSQLENLIGRKVINAGIPGELSSQGLNRLPALLDEHMPSLLVLCHGGNDLLRKKSKKQLAENLEGMVNMAKQRNIQVVLLGVPEPALFLLESAPVYQETAVKLSVPIEADILPEVLSDGALKSDHIHPNAEGYRKMAEALATLLQKAGAISNLSQ